MKDLLPVAHSIAETLMRRRETLAVCESSAGGLISAALLAVPGASAFFLGGTVVYTLKARDELLRIPPEALADVRASTEPYVILGARSLREQLGATWGLAESGATGPTGNRYGDPAGHGCFAVTGPIERSRTLETGLGDRFDNMNRFAAAALALLAEALAEKPS